MLWHIELTFCKWICFTVLQIKFECCQFASIVVGVMPLLELRILEIHSFPHFSLTCFDISSWNFTYDFVFIILQIKFECCAFASIFVWVMPHLGLRILEIQFSVLFSYVFDIWSWNFSYDFVWCTIDKCPSGSPSVYWYSALSCYMHRQNLKFKMWRWFLKCVSCRKVLYKNSLLKCSWRAYYAPLAVRRYIFYNKYQNSSHWFKKNRREIQINTFIRKGM